MNSPVRVPFLFCVVEHDGFYAPEHVLDTKVEFRVGFQPSLKVSSQVWLPCHLAIRRPQKTGGNGRDQLDCILILPGAPRYLGHPAREVEYAVENAMTLSPAEIAQIRAEIKKLE